MKNDTDFIINNGILEKYTGPGGNVVIPEGVTEIGSDAFEGCKKLKQVTIPEGVTKIGYQAFKSCSILTVVEIPETVIDIDSEAFAYCGKLHRLTIPNPEAFFHGGLDGCKTLSYVQGSPETIDKVLTFSSPAMKATLCYGYLQSDDKNSTYDSGCKRSKKKVLKHIVDDDNAIAMARYLALYKKPLSINELDELLESAAGKPNLTTCLLSYKDQHYSVQQISDNAMENEEKELGIKERTLKEWRKLFSLSIHDTISIFKYKGTDSIVTIPEQMQGKTVTEIGAYSFSERSDIVEVNIPENVEYIGWHAFDGCTGLTEMTIPEGVTQLGMFSFMNCTALKTVRLPSTLKKIESGVFDGCTALECVTFAGSDEISIEDNSFSNCPQLTIHAQSGSSVEQYAKELNIPFVAE